MDSFSTILTRDFDLPVFQGVTGFFLGILTQETRTLKQLSCWIFPSFNTRKASFVAVLFWKQYLWQFLCESVREQRTGLWWAIKNPGAPVRTLITQLVTSETKGGWWQCQLQNSCKGVLSSMMSGKNCKNTVQGWLINCILLAILIMSVYKLVCW